jgi:hypothetical protein
MLLVETPRTFCFSYLRSQLRGPVRSENVKGCGRERKMRRWCIISAHINRLGGWVVSFLFPLERPLFSSFFCVVHFAEKRVISEPVLQIARSSGRSRRTNSPREIAPEEHASVTKDNAPSGWPLLSFIAAAQCD